MDRQSKKRMVGMPMPEERRSRRNNVKAKTRFMKMYCKLPEEARQELVYDFVRQPMTVNVIYGEVRHDTELGKKILKRLGYKDE